MPSLVATEVIVGPSDGYSSRCLMNIRTVGSGSVRSPTSGEYRVFLGIAPSCQGMEPPRSRTIHEQGGATCRSTGDTIHKSKVEVEGLVAKAKGKV
jgi:hypothetical protein